MIHAQHAPQTNMVGKAGQWATAVYHGALIVDTPIARH